MNIKDNSNYEGSINSNNTAKNIVLSIDETSNFKLTSDCYVTTFDNKKSDNSNIDFNGYSLYVNNKKIN